MAQREAASSRGGIDGGIIFAVVAADILAAVWGLGMVEQRPPWAFYVVILIWMIPLVGVVTVLSFTGMARSHQMSDPK
jgi:hypothetical protein